MSREEGHNRSWRQVSAEARAAGERARAGRQREIRTLIHQEVVRAKEKKRAAAEKDKYRNPDWQELQVRDPVFSLIDPTIRGRIKKIVNGGEGKPLAYVNGYNGSFCLSSLKKVPQKKKEAE